MPVKKTHPSSFWSMMCHLSSLFGFVIPGGSLIAPLIVWGMKKDQDLNIYKNGQNVINFVLSFWIYSLGLFVGLFLLGLGIGLFSNLGSLEHAPTAVFLAVTLFFVYLGAYFLIQIFLPIYGGIKALNGEVYRYPFTISFLKEPSANPMDGKSSAK